MVIIPFHFAKWQQEYLGQKPSDCSEGWCCISTAPRELDILKKFKSLQWRHNSVRCMAGMTAVIMLHRDKHFGNSSLAKAPHSFHLVATLRAFSCLLWHYFFIVSYFKHSLWTWKLWHTFFYLIRITKKRKLWRSKDPCPFGPVDLPSMSWTEEGISQAVQL